jgi:F0F1-type ATP synthase membrane subunit b/b'
MPRVRDLLYRFRPSGAPGSASATGVPIDRAATVAAELEPLFGQLADVERQCDSIRDQARRDAAAIGAAAAERAHAIVAEANGRAGSERAAAVVRMRDRTAADGAAELAVARVEAAVIRDRASQRMAVYVDRVVTGVGELIGTRQEPGPP